MTLPAPLRSAWLAPLLLLGVLVGLSFVMDPRGSLGTDTGAKVITLEQMQRDDTASPVVGYWAAAWDPDGVAHPLFQAGQNDDGDWVIVTTLPMIELARPLYDLGGYRAGALLPMLGVIAAALAGWALARRLGDEDDGALAFWVVGVASPLLVYGLDLWEHSLGVAAMAWAVVLLVDVLRAPLRWWRPLVAGALLGAAATMRTESLVYALVSVGGTGLILLARRRTMDAVLTGLLSVVGFLGPWFANAWLEQDLGGQSRGSRASGAASAAGSVLGHRVQQALVTALGVKGDAAGSIVIGAFVVLLVGLAVRAERRGDRRMAVLAVGLVGLPYLFGAVSDFAFVPGAVAAMPFVLLGLRRPESDEQTFVLGVALIALPIVWAFSYVGGAGAQWGGRYILTSTVLVAVLATVGVTRRHPAVGPALLRLTLAISVLSVVFLGYRSRSVDDFFHDLRAVDADVVIVRDGFLVREGGAAAVGQHWLSVNNDDAFALATQVAEESGARTVAVLERGAGAPPPEAVPDGWEELGRSQAGLAGNEYGIVVYSVPGSGG